MAQMDKDLQMALKDAEEAARKCGCSAPKMGLMARGLKAVGFRRAQTKNTVDYSKRK